MHTEIDYNKLDLSKEDRETKALTDLREWMGDDKFANAVMLAHTKTETQMRNIFGFLVGVEGFPVTVFCERYCRKDN